MIDHVAAHPILETTAVSKVTTPEQLLKHLLTAANQNERRYLLAQFAPALSPVKQNQLADLLKKEADRLMWENIDLCFDFADLISQMAQLFDAPMFQALSLRARGNGYSIGLGKHEKGIDCYDEAAQIYAALGCQVEQAQSQNGKLYALANLSRYEEALATGEKASRILEAHHEWTALADMMVNLAIIHGQLSQDIEALQRLDQAKTLYGRLGQKAEEPLLGVELNRGILLRNLGRFNESIQALKAAQKFEQLGQSITAAQARQNLGMTYFVMGRYNEALTLLNTARDTFFDDGRERHAMLTELLMSDCLLALRRFNDVLAKCKNVRQHFSQQDTLLTLGQAILNEAKAHAGLGNFAQAQASVDEAHDIFLKDGNPTAVADAELQTAVLLAYQGQYEEAIVMAKTSSAIFANHQLPVGEARACLVAARAALHLYEHDQAHAWIKKALAIGQANYLPAIAYQGFQLEGELSQSRGQFLTALAAYEAAIDELEQLYGRLMIEFRADFLEDKERIYEETVLLCLHLKQPSRALEFCERAKSRALQDLLNLRINLNIEARSESDKPLVAQLHALRAERDRLYRRWEVDEEIGQRGDTADLLAAQQRTENKIVRLENEITDLWHKLLIRNADYARDAALWQVRAEPAQPYLPEDTLLLEFFAARGKLFLFLVTRSGIEAIQLDVTVTAVQQKLQLLWLNLRSVPRSSARQLAHLARNAKTVLQQLYDQLLLPGAAAQLASYKKWIVVPHGPLHYLPFAALHNGQQYLVETAEISMLPGSSLLRFCCEAPKGEGPLVAVGHSYNGRLPHAVTEAQEIAARWCGHACLEDEATLGQIEPLLANGRILHLATHGDFRADNPLFSGLALADGWLTTIDIFNLKLRASLVTLSACQTGRSIIGGGDELLGLMRAFLGAGAASLIASSWAVEDQTTAWLMHHLYEQLAQGATKAAALRTAQLQFLQKPELADSYIHPYFWAPFFLVGDAGNL